MPKASRDVRRGEVWLVGHTGSGSEIRGRRPALILQNDTGNHFAATTIVAAITTRAKPLPILVPVPAGDGGLKTDSAVNLSQIQTVSMDRLERRLGSLDAEQMDAVDRAIRISLSV